MKVFGSIDSFVETSETSLKLGRLVANFEFLKALLTYDRSINTKYIVLPWIISNCSSIGLKPRLSMIGYLVGSSSLKNLAPETQITQAGTDLNLPDMARVFEHYPSQILTDTTVLTLSELGHDVLQGKVLMPATYEDITPLLPGALLTCFLSRLMGNHASLSDIIQAGQSAFGAAPPVTRLCIIWLMKYGLLKTMPG